MKVYARYWRTTAQDRESETLLGEAALCTSVHKSSGADTSDSYTKSGSWSVFSEPALRCWERRHIRKAGYSVKELSFLEYQKMQLHKSRSTAGDKE